MYRLEVNYRKLNELGRGLDDENGEINISCKSVGIPKDGVKVIWKGILAQLYVFHEYIIEANSPDMFEMYKEYSRKMRGIDYPAKKTLDLVAYMSLYNLKILHIVDTSCDDL